MNIMNSIHILTYSVIHFIITLLPCSDLVIVMQLIFTIQHVYVHVYNITLSYSTESYVV